MNDTETTSLTQPLPMQVQEKVWAFVREQLKLYEDRAGAKVGKFEIHCTDAGRIEVEVLSTESEMDAAIDGGLEEAGLKSDVNRSKERERLAEDVS